VKVLVKNQVLVTCGDCSRQVTCLLQKWSMNVLMLKIKYGQVLLLTCWNGGPGNKDQVRDYATPVICRRENGPIDNDWAGNADPARQETRLDVIVSSSRQNVSAL
jgi:hypothetical protein